MRICAPILPTTWHKRVGLTVVNQRSPQPTLMVWVLWRGRDARLGELAEASVFDETGIESEPIHSRATVYVYEDPRGAVRGWEFVHFPRRGKKVGVRLYTRGNDGKPTRLAEFQVANPSPGHFPIWPVSPPPVTVQNGQQEFTLTRFTTGEPIAARLKPIRGWVAPWTSVAFRVAQNGQPSSCWSMMGVELSDATGNIAHFHRTLASSVEGQPEFGLNAALWRSEPAWRLKVEFAQAGDFAADELLSVNGITIPWPGNQTLIRTQAVIHGATLTLNTISRPPGPSGVGGLLTAAYVTGSLFPAERLRLKVARAVDDRGRELRWVPGNTSARGPHDFWVELRSGARSINLTVAVTRSRFVEFVATPTFVTTNSAIPGK